MIRSFGSAASGGTSAALLINVVSGSLNNVTRGASFERGAKPGDRHQCQENYKIAQAPDVGRPQDGTE